MDDAPWIPFSYVCCFWLVIIPKLWYWAINPRVEALEDMQNGKKTNKTCFTNHMPLTEKDQKI